LPLNNPTGAPGASGRAQNRSSEYQGQPSFSADPPPSAQPANGPKPSDMMKAMLTAPRDSQLRGDRISLVQAVSGARSRSEQTQRVEAYWDLCSSVADYYLGLREQEELRRLSQLVLQKGAAWEQTEKEMSVRLGTSQRAARAAQFRLASFIGRGPNNLPLPADMPHCGSYTSQYEKIFLGRSSAEAQELSQLLPQRHAELKDAATAVTRAEEWLDGVASQAGNSDGTGSLRALELLALRRRAFVQVARDYNRRIARYSELATPGQISAERLIGMLIIRDGAATATRPGVPTPLSSRQPGSSNASAPRTFVENENWEPAAGTRANATGTGDDSVQRASATQSGPRSERSLLVPRDSLK
jgi:hypothetical protein